MQINAKVLAVGHQKFELPVCPTEFESSGYPPVPCECIGGVMGTTSLAFLA